MGTKLERIPQLSAENPEMVFTSVGHLINRELLEECHGKMEGDRAAGTGGMTREEYGKNLEENLDRLAGRLKKKPYRPQPARLAEIPKDNGKTRPLSICCYEDRLVQEALRRLLEAVFEPHFYEEMMGFRPGRGCHMALRKLNGMIENRPTNYVLDADIKGFFNHTGHEWAVRFIESRIKDPDITRLAGRMLKAGIMKDFQYEETLEGSGRGPVCPPVTANIYMHYVLIWRFRETVKPGLEGYADTAVYAGDFVCCFQYKKDAEEFYEKLKQRMMHFGLEPEENKSRLVRFGRHAQEQCGKKPETFTFPGFTHCCSKSRNGKFRVKRKTSRKKFTKKCREVHRSVAKMRILPLPRIMKKVNQILTGYYHYYGITDNFKGIDDFCYRVKRSLFYWLNRRSQKRSYTVEAFQAMLKDYPLASPKIYVSIYG